MNELIERFNAELGAASERNEKLATFHYLILANAQTLSDVKVTEFCKSLKLPKGYVSEMTQMLTLHKIMVQRRAFLGQV